jgi:hypothetical protein
MAGKSKFVYHGNKRTVESVVRKSKQAGGLYDSYLASDVQMYKSKEGEACVRILPPTWEDVEKWGDGWEIGVYIHYSVGPDNGTYLCLDKMKGEPCPVCEARRTITDQDEADQLKPGYRTLAWVIDRDNEKAGPMIWSMPITMFKEINARSIDKKTNAPILVDDPEEGYDIVFNRAGTTKTNTKYSAVEVTREPSPLHDDEKLQARWLEYITEHPLPDVLNFYDAEHIEKVLFGKTDRRKDEEEVTEETETRPSRRGRAEPVEDEAEEKTGPAMRNAHRATRAEPEAEDRPTRGGRHSRGGAAEETEEPPFEENPRAARRRALLDEGDAPEEGETRTRPRASPPEDEGEPSPVQAARRSLERLKPRGRGS